MRTLLLFTALFVPTAVKNPWLNFFKTPPMGMVINPWVFPSGGGGPALVANTASQGDVSGNTTTTSAIDTTGANLIVVAVCYFNLSSPPTISDSKGNTYTQISTEAADILTSALYYYRGTNVGSSHTFSVNGAAIYSPIVVAAFSGIASSPLDVSADSNTGSSWTTLATGSVTPTQANTLVVSMLGNGAGSGTITINDGFSKTGTADPSSSFGASMAYFVRTSIAATQPTWSSSSSCVYGATITASFKY